MDWSNGTYFQVDIQSGTILKQTKINLDHVTDLITFDKASQTGTNPCAINNGGCQQLCLVKGSSRDHEPLSYHCSCETHFTLFKNNTCSGKNNLLKKYLLLTINTQINEKKWFKYCNHSFKCTIFFYQYSLFYK